LTRLGDALTSESDQESGRFVVGYPVFGYWARPMIGYADRDGDGVIQRSEISLADSAVYRGSPEPRYTATVSSSLGLWHGRVQLAASLDYQHAMTQYNALAQQRLEAAATAPTATLQDQAIARASSLYYLMQTVNVLRLNSLSVSTTLPAIVQRRLRIAHGSVALQGSNLALRTGYRGRDPNVNAFSNGNGVADYGQLPPPREWVLRINLSR